MGKLLTQEEVDALLKGLSDGEIETQATPDPGDAGIVPYDFTSRDRILRGRMPTMDIINERFARESASSLGQFMGRMLEVSVEGFELVSYAEWVRKLPDRVSLNLFRAEPLRGSCLLFFDARLIFLIVDILFGGSGKLRSEMQTRDFTAMEARVIHRLLGMCFQDLVKAWSIVVDLSVQFIRSETNPQFASIVDPEDIVMSGRFQVDLEMEQALMGYCIPYTAVEPLRGRLTGRLSSEQEGVDPDWRARVSDHMRAVSVEVTVELGTAEIPLRHLLRLRENDILPMSVGPMDPMILKIQDVPKGTCLAGQRNGNYAIEVVSIEKHLHKEKKSGSTGGTEKPPGRRIAGFDRGLFAGSP